MSQVQGVKIPKHLQYRPPKVENTFAHVPSRYRSPPRQHADPADFYAKKLHDNSAPKPTSNPEFAYVESRVYDAPKRKPSPERPRCNPSPELRRHQRQAEAMGIHAESKFYEVHNRPPPTNTRRDQVEAFRREASSKLQGPSEFKRFVKTAPSFDKIAKSNAAAAPERTSSPSRRSAHHSVVMAFVKDGTPIPGYDNKPKPRPKAEPTMGGRVFLGCGGAGGGNFGRRQSSPTKTQAAKEEQKVTKLAENMRTVRTSSPPRVAQMESRITRATREERQGVSSPQRRGSPVRTAATPAPVRSGRTSSPAPRSPVPSPRNSPVRRQHGDIGSRTGSPMRQNAAPMIFPGKAPVTKAFR